MKMRNKGKVYPSSSSSSSAGCPPLSVLNVLPATILGLAVVLSVEDREVLAYMITRSIKSSSSSSMAEADTHSHRKKTSTSHKPPLFDCDCFDCYTIYWFKWDSSPNRELIHQAIEAFEETFNHSNAAEKSKKKGKKRDKMGARPHLPPPVLLPEECHVPPPPVEEKALEDQQDPTVEATAVVMAASHQQHKGLARKVLPDVIGLFNWRLWSLWSPNV